MKSISKLIGLLTPIAIGIFISCHQETPEAITPQKNQTDSYVIRQYKGENVQFKKLKSGHLAIGDMLFSERDISQSNTQTEGIIMTNKWPKVNGRYEIPYVIDRSATYRAILQKGIDNWNALSNQTNIVLVKRTNQPDYIDFRGDWGVCMSFIGRQGGKQMVQVNGCPNEWGVMHEIGHVIGFDHEQCHPRRDQYIVVHFDRIDVNFRPQYEKVTGNNFRTSAFDFNSIMLYGSRNTIQGPDMTKLDGSTFESPVYADNPKVSNLMIKAINKVYQ